MGRILNFLAKQVEKRSSLNISDPNHWITQITGRLSTTAGVNVTAETALATSTVFACVKVIAETIASLPLIIYRRENGSKSAAPNHPLYPLLHDIGPAPWLTAPEFWENMIGHNVLRGNAYAFKVRNGADRIIGLVPLSPARIDVKVDLIDFENPRIIYEYTLPDTGRKIDIDPSDIWHLKGMSTDGFVGISTLAQMREAVGMANAAEAHGSIYFKNGAKASGIVTHPGRMKDDSYQRFKGSIQDAISGSNKYKVLLLEEGATWTQTGMSNEDSQFLETRQFQVEDIARFFRVPAILIGHPDKSSTYASAEQFMMSFVTHTIRPWLVRIEKSILKNLMSQADQNEYFAEFKVDALLRGDTKSRYESYSIAIQNTILSPNEARALENLPPRAGGDEYVNPNITVKNDNAENGSDADNE